MLIRAAFLVMLMIMMIPFVEAQDKFITLSPAKPQHQRVTYRIRDDANAKTFYADGRVREEPFSFTGELETLPTAQRDDGSRIMQIALRIADKHSETNDSSKRATLSITLDKNGSFLKLSGIRDQEEDEEEETTMGAFTGAYICPGFVMFPAIMIPAKPVKCGENWNLHITSQTAGHDSFVETLSGTGGVRSLPDSKVLIEIDYTSEMMDLPIRAEPELKETSVGSLVLTYDMQSGLVVKCYSHSATQTIGWSFSDNDDAITTIIEHEVTLTLMETTVRSRNK